MSVKKIIITILQFVGTIFLSSVLYVITKAIVSGIAIDVFNLDRVALSRYEPLVFTVFVIVVSLGFVLLIKINAFLKADPDRVSNEIQTSTYSKEDYDKIGQYYSSTIKKALINQPAEYNILSKRYPKSIYAIIGGWRAGKTTASAMLLNVLRKKQKILSETYHDSFNFGNVDESISSFFGILAQKTKISLFNDLGKVSTPGIDMKFEVGPLTLNRSTVDILSPNKIRSNIYKKLLKNKGIHVVIIDDIDRLVAEEQIQWLRVIELLGKFHSKLLVIVPVHLDQVADNLLQSGVPSKYLQKILPNRIRVGVDVDFIKLKFGINDQSTDDLKRKYSKYLYSLVLRMAISKINSGEVSNRSEWKNDFESGNFSTTALAFSQGLRFYDGNDQRGTRYVKIADNRSLWGTNRDEYKSMYPVRISSDLFLSRARSDIQIGKVDLNELRSIHTLKEVFNTYGVFDSDRYNSPDFDAIGSQPDFWLNYGWKAIEELNADPHLSEYFQYDQISDEIGSLLKDDTIDSENSTLHQLVLKMDS